MKVIVLGSGVIGTTSALASRPGRPRGHGDRPARQRRQETSHANAGEVSPGYWRPGPGRACPSRRSKWLLMQHRPLVIRPNLDMAMIRWGLQMLRNCTAALRRSTKGRMVRLAEYSPRRAARDARRAGPGLRRAQPGHAAALSRPKQLDGAGADIEVLKRYGVRFELLDRAGCIRHEPALARVQDKFLGGLLLPGDETGDCFKFTVQALAARSRAAA